MKTIVAPVDFSAGTSKVIEQTVALAKAFASTVYLLHSVTPIEDSSSKASTDMEEIFREESNMLNQYAQTIRDQGIETHAILIEGVTAITILDEAKNVSADLIVMGTHGHGVIADALLGGASQGVVRKSTCPVHLVPTRG